MLLALDEVTFSLARPLLHKQANPSGRSHFDVLRMRHTLDPVTPDASGSFSGGDG